MLEFLSRLWTYEVPPLQIAAAFAVAEAPMWIRKWTKTFYVPIYVSFLLDSLNDDLSIYFGEDITGVGETLDEAGVRRLKRRLMWTAFMSMILSALITPLFAGVAIATFLDLRTFLAFLVVMALYRGVRCVISYINFGGHAVNEQLVARHSNRTALAMIYVGYVGCFTQLTYNAYAWARPFVEKGEWLSLLGNLSNVLFVNGVALALLLSAISTVFTNFLADPDIRANQLRHIHEQQQWQKRFRDAASLLQDATPAPPISKDEP